MKYTVTLPYLLTLLLAVTGMAAVKEEQDLDDSWMQTYYQHPKPERFEAEVKKLQAAGALQNEGAMPPAAAFFSRLFQSAKPEQLAQWVKFVGGLPEKDQQVFLVALQWAATKETKAALEELAAGKGKSAKAAKKLLGEEAPAIEKIQNPDPSQLDMCWGAFFATGDPAYALVVIRCAAKPDKPKVIDVSQQAARWSLKSLCQDHQKLREIKDEFYKNAGEEERKVLDKLFKK